MNGRRLVTVHERLDEPIPASAECVVLGISGSERRRRLRAFARQPVLESAPLVVVHDGPVPEWVESELRAKAFASWKRARAQLVPRILRVICSTRREWMREEVRVSLLAPILSKAIVYALRACDSRPFRLPSDLAKAVGIRLPALDDAFRVATAGTFTVTEFLAALQLVRALEHRAAGRTWTAAAEQVSFTRRSLSRKSKAWPACTLRQLEAWDPPTLLARLRGGLPAPDPRCRLTDVLKPKDLSHIRPFLSLAARLERSQPYFHFT